MDERALLLLGILKTQRLHGYQINEFIDKNLSRITDMKKATAYAILDKLHNGNYISVEMEQQGNRPPRKVYSITEAGEELFQKLLKENLAQQEQITFKGDIGLMFYDHLPKADVLRLMQARLKDLETQLTTLQAVPPHGFARGVEFSIEHHLAYKQAEKNWLISVIDRIQNE